MALFGSTPDTPNIPPPPTRSDKDPQAAALKQRRLASAAMGRSKTQLGGGQGYEQDNTNASVTLLGHTSGTSV